MTQSKITDYFSEEVPYKTLKEHFNNTLEALNNGLYKKSSIYLASDEDEESIQNAIGDEEVKLLCDALKNNPHVKKLEFYLQRVGDEGAKALAEVDTVEDISIYCGTLGVSGGCALAQSKLKGLTIYGCYIFYDENDDEVGKEAEKFVEALIDNRTIKELSLEGTYIYKNLLVELIERTKSIESLYIGNRNFNKDLFEDLHISQKEMRIHVGEEIVLLGEEVQENNI